MYFIIDSGEIVYRNTDFGMCKFYVPNFSHAAKIVGPTTTDKLISQGFILNLQ